VSYRIEITGLEPLIARMQAGDQTIAGELREAMAISMAQIEADAKSAVPRDTGMLYRSIVSEVRSVAPLEGVVGVLRGPATGYARTVEEGRRPGAAPPPSEAIGRWLRRKGSNAPPYVVARSIGRRGIPARPYLRPAYERNAGRVKEHFQRVIERIVRRLAG
jgi:HK97 gp10 family phage protein